MLPPGHAVAGALVALGTISILQPNITPEQTTCLLIWGAFWGFAPDLDTFYTFAKVGKFVNPTSKADHRIFLTHTPLLWLIVGLLWYLIAGSDYQKIFGLLIWLGSWSHFALDSIQYGVRWLWPVSKEKHALLKTEKKVSYHEDTFFAFWFRFLGEYVTVLRPTFVSELIVLCLGVYFLLKML